jgi:hypothetical protein
MDNIKVILKVISQSLGEFEIDMEPDEVYNLSPEIDIKHLYEIKDSEVLSIDWENDTLIGYGDKTWFNKGNLVISYYSEFTLTLKLEIGTRRFNFSSTEVAIEVSSITSEFCIDCRSIPISTIPLEFSKELHAYRCTIKLPY